MTFSNFFNVHVWPHWAVKQNSWLALEYWTPSFHLLSKLLLFRTQYIDILFREIYYDLEMTLMCFVYFVLINAYRIDNLLKEPCEHRLLFHMTYEQGQCRRKMWNSFIYREIQSLSMNTCTYACAFRLVTLDYKLFKPRSWLIIYRN